MNLVEALKKVSSISFVSSKLGVSRPTLYRYIELYEGGDKSKIPAEVRDFFDYCYEEPLTEDVVYRYFYNPKSVVDTWNVKLGLSTCMTGGNRAIVILRNPEDDRSVEVATDISGETIVIGTYHIPLDKRFVLIDDLVPGHSFKYRVVNKNGNKSEWTTFIIESRVSSPDRRNLDDPLRTP